MSLRATEVPKKESLAREVIGSSVDLERAHHGELRGEVAVAVVAQVEVKASEPSRRYRKASPLPPDTSLAPIKA